MHISIHRHTITHFIAFCFTELHKYCIFPQKLKVGSNCTSSKSIGTIFPAAFAYVSVSCFGNPNNISNIFNIIKFVMAICYQWSLMLLPQFTEGFSSMCLSPFVWAYASLCKHTHTHSHTHTHTPTYPPLLTVFLTSQGTLRNAKNYPEN